MLTKLLFVLYAGLIPLVPLIGAHAYSRSGSTRKRNVCIAIFAVQTLISLGSIISYL